MLSRRCPGTVARVSRTPGATSTSCITVVRAMQAAHQMQAARRIQAAHPGQMEDMFLEIIFLNVSPDHEPLSAVNFGKAPGHLLL